MGGYTTSLIGSAKVGNQDMFMQKFSADLNTTIWTNQFGSSGYDEPEYTTVDADDNIWVAGVCTGVVGTVSGAGKYDACWMKLNSSTGAVEYASQVGGDDDDYAKGIDVDTVHG